MSFDRALSRGGFLSGRGALSAPGPFGPNHINAGSGVTPSPDQAVSTTERGVTFNFVDASGAPLMRSVGQFWDGSWWVHNPVGGNGLRVGSVSPASANVGGTRWQNGLMVNPGSAYVTGSIGANGLGTPGDLAANTYGTLQGYDQRQGSGTSIAYSAAMNFDPGKIGSALVFAAGEEATLAKAVSLPSPATSSSVQKIVYLTIVATIPAANSLRPAPSAISKASPGLAANIDLTVLPSLATPAYTPIANETAPTLADAQAWSALPYLFSRTDGSDAEGIYPIDQQPAYGRDTARRLGTVLLVACGQYTDAEKASIARGIAQFAIDACDRIANGGVFYANGGHNHWRQCVAAVGARLMRNMAGYAGIAAIVADKTKWAEGRNTTVVTKGMIAFNNKPTHASDTDAQRDFADFMLDSPNWNNAAAWAIAYRDITIASMRPLVVAASLVNGARTLINNESLWRYWITRVDSYLRANIQAGPASTNWVWAFPRAMGDAYVPQLDTGSMAAAPFAKLNCLWLKYDKLLAMGSVPATGDFVVTVNGSSRSVTAVEIFGYSCALTISGAQIAKTDTVVVSYTPGTNKITSVAGTLAGALTSQSVTALDPYAIPSTSFDTVTPVSGAKKTVTAPSLANVQKVAIMIEFAEPASPPNNVLFSSASPTNTFLSRLSGTQFRFQFSSSSARRLTFNVSPSTSLRRLMIACDGTGTANQVWLDDTQLSLTEVNATFNVNLNAIAVFQTLQIFSTFTGSIRQLWMAFGDSGFALPDLSNQTVRDAFKYANQIGNNGRGPANILPQPLWRFAAPLAAWNDPDGLQSEGSNGTVAVTTPAAGLFA